MNEIQSTYKYIEHAVNECVAAIIKSVRDIFKIFHAHVYVPEVISDSNVVVMLTATHDHNGALSERKASITRDLHSNKNVRIIYKYVSSIEDIETRLTEIKSLNNSIKGLWINAHGTPTSFELGKHCANGLHNVSNFAKDNAFGNTDLLKNSLDMLDEDANIILDSCSTAHIDSDGNPSIAQTIASLAPGRRVYATTTPTCATGFHFAWDTDAITARFTIPKKSHCPWFLGDIADLFLEMVWFYSDGHYGNDDTAIFKQ